MKWKFPSSVKAHRDHDGSDLRQTLWGVQIFFIVLSAVIGGGVFTGNGKALEIAGPAGFLTAVILMGLLSILVLDGVSEFAQLFPVKNAIVEYTRAFVDQELGWIIGIAYWYTFASIFSAQNLAAADLLKYWDVPEVWQIVGFYIIGPIILLGVNICPVWVFGWIECVGGFLKLCLVVGSALFMYIVAGEEHIPRGGYANAGFQDDKPFVTNHPAAVCYAIPIVLFSYLGQEIFLVTAYEARKPRDLRWPSIWMPIVVLFLYLMAGIGDVLDVSWTDPHLPKISGSNSTSSSLTHVQRHITPNETGMPHARAMPVINAWSAGYHNFAGFLNACLIFSVLSASNTSLYVASRTLYAMAAQIPDTNFVGKRLQWLKIVERNTGVPAPALLVSWIAFIWLPFVALKGGAAGKDLEEVMTTSASVSLLIVWMILCVAFIRYCRWLKRCDHLIAEDYPEFKRLSKEHTQASFTLFRWAQPFFAFCGFLGCLASLSFASTTWWYTSPTLKKVAAAYAAPLIFTVTWLVLKSYRWYFEGTVGFVKSGYDAGELATALSRLSARRREPLGREMSEEHDAAENPPMKTDPGMWHHESQQYGGLNITSPEN